MAGHHVSHLALLLCLPNACMLHCLQLHCLFLQLLCANVIVNGLMNVHTQNKALSEKPGVLHMSATLPDGVGAHKLYSELDATGDSACKCGCMCAWYSWRAMQYFIHVP